VRWTETFLVARRVVSSCPRLTYVNIRDCALIGPETVTALLKARGPSLNALSLAGLEVWPRLNGRMLAQLFRIGAAPPMGGC
jgi:hypothetical protein